MSTSKGDPDGVAGGRSADTVETTRAEPDPPSNRGDDLPLDIVFDILKNRRRRLVLRYLVHVSETSTLSDLAEYIASIENDKPEGALSSSERKRVYVCLYQCHLPKMDDAGVIDFENDRGTVELNDEVEQLTRYLDSAEEEPDSDWPKYYAAAAVVGGGLFVAQRLVLPSAILSGIIIGALIGLFVNMALEHAYDRDLLRPGLIRRRRPTPGAAERN